MQPAGKDRALLNLLASQGGNESPAKAVVQHADMVYATCRRVLGNDAEAADVAQETFFQFIKNSRRIRGSIAAWLHQVATNRAIDVLRRDTSRRRREGVYAADCQSSEPDEWGELQPLVDQALEALPASARELLVEHYLDRRSMVQIGQDHGLSQPTVSRRIAAALEDLRTLLRDKGIVVGAAGLGTMLTGAAQAAPTPMLQVLGKMVLAHSATQVTTAQAVAAGSSLLGGGAKTAATVGAALLIAGLGFQAFRPSHTPPLRATNTAPAAVFFGFSTNVAWTIGPDGRQTIVRSSGTNFAITNYGETASPPSTTRDSLSP